MKKLFQYLRESREEIAKVTWPTRKEAIFYSVAVIAICIVLAVFIGVIDFGLSKGVEVILDKEVTPTTTVDTASQPIQVSPEDIQVTTEPTTK